MNHFAVHLKQMTLQINYIPIKILKKRNVIWLSSYCSEAENQKWFKDLSLQK